MKASEFYQSPFLRGTDISKPVRAQIERYEVGEFTDQKTGQEQKRIILRFTGKQKALVLNKSQARTLITAYGDEMDGWPGKSVILSPGQAPNGQPTIVLAAMPEDEPVV